MTAQRFYTADGTRVYSAERKLLSPIHLVYGILVLLIGVPLSAGGQGNDDKEKGGRLPKKAGKLVDRAKALNAAEDVTTEKYPDAHSVLVDDKIVVRYNRDGTSVTWDEWYTKILTEKGRKGRRTMSLHFTIPYSLPKDVRVPTLEVIKPDGTTREVNVARQSRIMIDPSQMRSNIFNPKSKVLRVTIPHLEVGDVIHYVTYRRVRKARIPGVWSNIQLFEYTTPIRRLVYEVHAPSGLPLKHRVVKDPVKDTLTHTHKNTDKGIVHRWEARDVPRIFKEPRMPPLTRVAQRLLLSTAENWEAISKWYWSISSPHYETNRNIRKKVEKLVEGTDNRRERIRSLFRFVSQEIRYLGITTQKRAPGYEPQDVKATYKSRAGVCRDKAALLVAMLRETGLKAYPVLIHSKRKKDPDVPVPFFNHAIVGVSQPDGDYLLMDPTDENTRKLLPAYLSNRSFLVAKPEGETLRTTAVEPASKNLVHIDTKGVLQADGDLSANTTIRFEGINDNVYRGYLARQTAPERRRLFERLVKNVIPGATLKNSRLKPDHMQDISQRLTAELSFEAEDITVSSSAGRLLPLPFFGSRVGFINFILRGTGLESREYPFRPDLACGVKETFHIVLPSGAKAVKSLPDYRHVAPEGLSFKRDVSVVKDGLKGSSNLLLTKAQFSPGEYKKLKQGLQVIQQNRDRIPLLVPADRDKGEKSQGKKAKAITLLERVRYDVSSRHSWKVTREVRKRILTYAGKKSYSEIRIPYNPAWESVRLKYAKVTKPSGRTLKIKPRHTNRMDAGWVGSAPRYPGSKTLVASLPGVAPGCTIHYAYQKKNHNKPFFAGREVLRDMEPIVRKTVTVTTPTGMALTTHSTPTGIGSANSTFSSSDTGIKIEKNTKKHQDRTERTWEVKNVPAIERERDLPPFYAFNPVVTFTTGKWSAYMKRVRDTLTKLANQRADHVQNRVQSITDDADNKREKIRAVRDYVARNIRAAGPALHEVPLSALSEPSKTLEQGYGNSADRAVLLYSMLSSLQYNPEFVLASAASRVPSLQKVLRRYPDPGWFGEVLVLIHEDGSPIILNDTDEYAELGTTPHYGRPSLRPSGKIKRIQAPPEKRTRTATRFRITVDPDGDAEVKVRTLYFGRAYANQNRKYAMMSPQEAQHAFEKTVTDLSQAAQSISELQTAFDVYPGIKSYKVHWPGFAVKQNGVVYFRVPASLRNLFQFGADTRTNPLYRARAERKTVDVRIKLPAEWGPLKGVPSELEWQEPGGRGRINIQVHKPQGTDQKRTLRIVYRADLKPAVIPATRYKTMLRIMEKLNHAASRTVLLERERKQKKTGDAGRE